MLSEKCIKLNEVEVSYASLALITFKMIYSGNAKLLVLDPSVIPLYEAAYVGLDVIVKSHKEEFPDATEDGQYFSSLIKKIEATLEKFALEEAINVDIGNASAPADSN